MTTTREEAREVAELLAKAADKVIPTVEEEGLSKATLVRLRVERTVHVASLTGHLLESMRGWRP